MTTKQATNDDAQQNRIIDIVARNMGCGGYTVQGVRYYSSTVVASAQVHARQLAIITLSTKRRLPFTEAAHYVDNHKILFTWTGTTEEQFKADVLAIWDNDKANA